MIGEGAFTVPFSCVKVTCHQGKEHNMKRYEYTTLDMGDAQSLQEGIDRMNAMGRKGWRRVDYEGTVTLFERELPEGEPGSDEPSGPVPLNEDVAFYKQDRMPGDDTVPH
jgi:hypothetical protein